MRYLSVCSGIEAATTAWHGLGWTPVAFSEIEPFPSAVLAHHYPSVPNWGDMTKFQEWPDDRVDLLVGGTPCQSFSVAGLRKGLADPRGNLALVYLGIANKYRPKWIVWENVPGVLSSNGGRDFGSFLGALVQLGYGFAYRVLDAANFGCASTRERVFVLGYFGDWRRPAAVLFEPPSVARHRGPGRRSRALHPCLTARGARAFDDRTGYVLEDDGIRITTPVEHERALGFPDGYTAIPVEVLHAVRRSKTAFRVSPAAERSGGAPFSVQDLLQRESPRVQKEEHVPRVPRPLELGGKVQADSRKCGDDAGRAKRPVRDMPGTNEAALRGPLPRDGQGARNPVPRVQHQTARSGELGFLASSEKVPRAVVADGPRYKALGNSMAVPVMRWIGQRIQAVELFS